MNITRFNYPMGCLTNLGSFESQLAPGKWEKVGKWMNWIDLVKCQHALRLLCNEKCETGGNFRFRFRITRVCTIQHKSRDREKGFWKKKKNREFFDFFFLNFNKKEMSRVCVAQSCFGPVWRGFLFFFFSRIFDSLIGSHSRSFSGVQEPSTAFPHMVQLHIYTLTNHL